MTREHVQRLLALAGVRGSVDALRAVLGTLDGLDVDAVALVGDLGPEWGARPDLYRAIFKALGETGLPAFWVPGADDAPLAEYLRESYNFEIVYPLLHGVHGTVAFAPGSLLVAGMGGEIRDDPETRRAEEYLLRYPGWEVEYRFKVLRELEEHERIFLFFTPPAHKGLHGAGSETLAELVKTYNPRIVVTGGIAPVAEQLGRSLVVCPGQLSGGSYAVVDVRSLEVEKRALGEHAPAG